MSMCGPKLAKAEVLIDRAQAHGSCKAVDRAIQFAQPYLDHSAVSPSERQVRINQQRSIKKTGAIFKISDDIGEGISGVTDHCSIVPSQFYCPSGQPSGFDDLLLSVDDPPKSLASDKTRRCYGIRRRKIRIKFNGFVKQTKRFLIPFPGPFVNVCQSAK